MKSSYSTSWKSSTQPRKQRKYAYNAPYHVKGKLLSAHLSKELSDKYNTRSVRVRTGDTVKIMRGSHAGKEGKVERVDLQRTKIFVENISIDKHDGSKVGFGLHPSNVLVVALNLDDKKRKAKLEKGVKNDG